MNGPLPPSVEPNPLRLVGMGEVLVEPESSHRLGTYGLSEGVAILAYEPHLQMGGLLHAAAAKGPVEPVSTTSPAQFLDTGVPLLLKGMRMLGARAHALRFAVIGPAGAPETAAPEGRDPLLSACALLQNLTLQIVHRIETTRPDQTVQLDLRDGSLKVRCPGATNLYTLGLGSQA